MKSNQSKAEGKSEAFRRFEGAVKKIISVPKAELDRREAEYQKQRKAAAKKRDI